MCVFQVQHVGINLLKLLHKPLCPQYGKSWEATPESLVALALPSQDMCDQPTPEIECKPLAPEDNQCLILYDKDKFGPVSIA